MRSVVVGMAPRREAPLIEPEAVRLIRELQAKGWGAKAIARELGITRNTVRRYLRGGAVAEVQVRPKARSLDEEAQREAVRLFESTAEGNAVVVRDLLVEGGHEVGVRTVQRAVADRRRAIRAADVASVRFETGPGQQMQIDFGEKKVVIGGVVVRVYLLAAVLGYSRRMFVQVFLNQRGDDWREGIAGAFRHFGGVPRTVLGDNAKALVVARDRVAQTVTFHPAYLAFCRDWDVEPRACRPFRARTKGKIESGVKYVKRNGLAGRTFETFAALEQHLARWVDDADRREHGTTHEAPAVRFEQEKPALRALPARPLPTREQRLERRVSNDALVDVDTVRYSVPHRLVRETVEVLVGEVTVQVFHGSKLVAKHDRSREPHARIEDRTHYEGLWRQSDDGDSTETVAGPLKELGSSLAVYEAVVVGQGAA